MNTILIDFLITEIHDQDLYDCIFQFITSPHIRNGDFECNSYVIKKVDLNNFCILPDDIYYPDNRHGEIYNCILILKDKLIKEINDHAQKVGLIINE
jgi:hypothetical protein